VQTLGAITFKTLDKVVQEDARAITFDGSELGGVHLTSSFSEDLRVHNEVSSALTFNLLITKYPTQKVSLEMLCESEITCEVGLDVTELFSSLPLNQWQNVSIDLACFTGKGLNMGKLITPFKLTTQGRLSLSFADISLKPDSAKQASLSCSN
jgi:beta-glucosidase